MLARSPWATSATGMVCWRCQWRLLNQPQTIRQLHNLKKPYSQKVRHAPQRALHATAIVTSPITTYTVSATDQLQPSQLAKTPATNNQPFDPSLLPRPAGLPVREHLEQWQQLYGGPSDDVLAAFQNYSSRDGIQNSWFKLSSGFKSDENLDSTAWEDAEKDAGEDAGEELITIGLFLKPGDVVELSQPGREPVLAVFVQQVDQMSQFFSVNGRWTHTVLNRISFAIPGCIDPVRLQPLLPYLPTSYNLADPKGGVHVPMDLAAPIQHTLERMTQEAEKIYRTNAAVLDTAYAVLADPARTRMMTLMQIAKALLAGNDPAWNPSPSALLAVRKALHHNEFRFNSDARSHRLTNVFAIRPKNDVQNVETVHEWVRDYREYLALSARESQDSAPKRSKGATIVAEFLEKSRRLVAKSRKTRDPNNGTVGPSMAKPAATDSDAIQIAWDESFSSTDKQIINFLQAWTLSDQFASMAGLHAACASLILATDCYGPDVIKNAGQYHTAQSRLASRATGFLFLQEIGVLTPYENRHIYDEQLGLPSVRLSRNLELLQTKAESMRKAPDFQDSMATLRRDWGSTTIYCIDDAGAHEIDDGVSIERIAGQEGQVWVHVHVANPTAFFDKTHTLSGLAAHMTESVYTPETFYPMIPTWATQGFFSLDQNRPVITFSSRLNHTGKVLETKIQHGIIRKIVSITPDEVASLLGDNTAVEKTRLVVGGNIPIQENKPALPNLSPDQLQDLKDLYAAAQALWAIRKAAGAVRFETQSPSVRVFKDAQKAGLTWVPPSTDRARAISGDPIIDVSCAIPRANMSTRIGPRNLVEELMILGCSTAASWCAERNIPVMYRGTVEAPPGGDLPPAQLKEMALSHLAQHGNVPFELASRYMKSMGKAIAHSAPIPHRIMGVPHYVKVTSPLRRFSDMIAHWQIEAALKYEARSGKKFDATASTRDVLRFSQHQLQESIITLSTRERIIGMVKRSSVRFWTVLALQRAFNYNQAPLPDVFKFLVSWVPEDSRIMQGLSGVSGSLPEYGVRAKLLGEQDAQIGDEWEVKLESMNVFTGDVFVKPVRLVNRASDAS
jgi:hypothetical protein